MTPHELGRLGEFLAVNHLRTLGYYILECNWNLHHGYEIDIIAEKDNVLHFVEVKTRSSMAFGDPIEAIDTEKLMHIYHAGQHYIEFTRSELPWQIDTVGIVLRTMQDYDISLYEDVQIQCI